MVNFILGNFNFFKKFSKFSFFKVKLLYFFDGLSGKLEKVLGLDKANLTLENLNDPTVTAIPFAKLMNSIDTNNRWVYNGSLTTPPCTKNIYWKVVGTVYPIKPKHLSLF